MKTWQKRAICLGALGLLGVGIPRYFWVRRRRFPHGWQHNTLTSRSQPHLSITHLQNGHKRLIIIAHGLMKTMNDPDLIRLASMLGERFDVLLFDFPGHGRSSGECDLNFDEAADHLRRIVDHGRELGYDRIGILGYSMGAAAAIFLASQNATLDAIVSVSCPVTPNRCSTPSAQASSWPWRWWANTMGTRIVPQIRIPSWPIEKVASVSPIPILIVHHGLDNLVSTEAAETFFAIASPPKDYLYVSEAFHTSPMASAKGIMEWLDEKIPS